MTRPRRSPAPKAGTLADPAVAAERAAALAAPHVAPLRAFVARLRAAHGAVPDADPHDGGVAATCLLLLESPGPRSQPLRFVSRDNATGTAANLRRFLAASGIARSETLIWNAVPWVIHAPGARNRAPSRVEAVAGIAELPPLLGLLPSLRVVVLAGRVAAQAEATVRDRRPDLAILVMPHPSPTIVCTSPAVAAHIMDALAEAAAILRLPATAHEKGRPEAALRSR